MPRVIVEPRVPIMVRVRPKLRAILEAEAQESGVCLAELVRAILERAVRGEGR